MTNNNKDFIGPIICADVCIIEINGIFTTCYISTIKWSFEDSNSCCHNHHIIPGTHYSPNLPCLLLLPQHWAQTWNDNSPKNGGTICQTYNDRYILCWPQGRFDLTVRLYRNSNVAYICTITGYWIRQICQLLHSCW